MIGTPPAVTGGQSSGPWLQSIESGATRRKAAKATGVKVEPTLLLEWTPNQLRHSAATEIRKRFGLEAAQVAMGHAQANITQLYAERDLNLAAEVMRNIG